MTGPAVPQPVTSCCGGRVHARTACVNGGRNKYAVAPRSKLRMCPRSTPCNGCASLTSGKASSSCGSAASTCTSRHSWPSKYQDLRECRVAPLRASEADEGSSSTVKIHYHRPDEDYKGWTIHVWDGAVRATEWESGLAASGIDQYGLCFLVPVLRDAPELHFIVHRGDQQEATGVLNLQESHEAWMVAESCQVWTSTAPDLALIAAGDLSKAEAFWPGREYIAFQRPVPTKPSTVHQSSNLAFYLHASSTASLELTAQGVVNAEITLPLDVPSGGLEGSQLPPHILEKFPHISSLGYVLLPRSSDVDIERLVQCQLALEVKDLNSGIIVRATGVQIPGVLDEAFAYDGPLGAEFKDSEVDLRVWAPTAQSVNLLLFDSPDPRTSPVEVLAMTKDMLHKGVWCASSGTSQNWNGLYYNYEVKVFSPATMQIETSIATDPYSRSLSCNGLRTHICDIAQDSNLFPADWSRLGNVKPRVSAPSDIAIYELHIRDFSALDKTIPKAKRGTYAAFSERGSACVEHLKSISDAGMTHVHLLPTFDYGTVNERREEWKYAEDVAGRPLEEFPADSEEQQKAVFAVADEDSFNWGYDPVHYGVPEGSYASIPDGSTRILEFREMVSSINRTLGLNVVMDVVYNHNLGSGPHGPHSVLDKIVPGYYLRRDLSGNVEASTCMNNTACEHAMMSRLIVDDLVHWVRDYKIDGFRFDLMGHLMLATLQEALTQIRSLTLEEDGVRGEDVYFYGEGWDFAEVASSARGVNASQMNLYGTGIGSFNDRIREGVNGGSPFGDPRVQGFATGLYHLPNGFDQGTREYLKGELMGIGEKVMVAMAGNLRNYRFVNRYGDTVEGKDAFWEGSGSGYAASPEETVNYVSAHDNETLFDTIMYKVAPTVTLADRIRVNWTAMAIIAFSQGIPFFHAGDEILRSKSLDRDSYNSSDWFNRLDFTYETNNWGVGLPGEAKNGDKWDMMRPLLADPALKPSREQIVATVEHMKTILSIRMSSPLFRLKSLQDIQDRVHFYNTGVNQYPGVIVMEVADLQGVRQLDRRFQRIVVVVNPTPLEYCEESEEFKEAYTGRKLELHPSLIAQEYDSVIKRSLAGEGTVSVPGYTTAVFVEHR
mmetsp:Transcript_9644/g.35336  ORF Transcript_9644/g.35336 Transcript_9644/m.35336 type:complete len:1115 (+) Transcript_9644:143-3487(+)